MPTEDDARAIAAAIADAPLVVCSGDVLVVPVPGHWSVERIADFIRYLDLTLCDLLRVRVNALPVPGGAVMQVLRRVSAED